jgi:putative FmdB family regulatory protein
MPTYDYVCTKCGHTFEAFQRMSDKPLSRCPECKGAVRRLIGGGLGVIFKGSGFYSTDNKRGSVLTGGNGGSKDSKDSKDKEKPAEKAKEGSGDTSSAKTDTPTEKKAAS